MDSASISGASEAKTCVVVLGGCAVGVAQGGRRVDEKRPSWRLKKVEGCQQQHQQQRRRGSRGRRDTRVLSTAKRDCSCTKGLALALEWMRYGAPACRERSVVCRLSSTALNPCAAPSATLLGLGPPSAIHTPPYRVPSRRGLAAARWL